MSPFHFRASVLALALALAGLVPEPAVADAPIGSDAASLVAGGLKFIKRLLHLRQGEDVLSHSIAFSPREASLELELASRKVRAVALRAGSLLVDGQRVAAYEVGGPLDRAWRRLLQDGTALESRAFLVAARAWSVPGLSGDDAVAKHRIDQALHALGAQPPSPIAAAIRADTAPRVAAVAPRGNVEITLSDLAAIDSLEQQLAALPDIGADVAASVRNSPMRIGDYAVPAGVRHEGNVVVFKGDADIFGMVTGNVVALGGDVTFHRGGEILGSAVSVGGDVLDEGGTVRGDIKTLSALPEERPDVDLHAAVRGGSGTPRAAVDRLFRDVRTVVVVFIALAMVGFGLAFFGRRYLEVVADTAAHSFGRSLVVGLLGQLLLLPTFAMLIVGLTLTIVGILLVPIAVPAYVLAAVAALLGGYLAVAHAIGETFTRRRMANGAFVRSPNAYGYLFTGLLGLLGLWAFAALLGWAGPVVILVRIAAAIVTWVALTSGFGAVLLSRGGLRETFAGRYAGEMSDEYLWATPPATPTSSRMGPKA